MTDTQLIIASSIEHSDEIVHWTCCEDGNTAICGTDVSGHTWKSDDEDVTCVVCIDVEDTDYCPRFETCSWETS